MSERAITITKKQHDQINLLRENEAETLAAAQEAVAKTSRELSLYVQPFIDGQEDEIPPSKIVGARCTDGVYTLVLDVPDTGPALVE